MGRMGTRQREKWVPGCRRGGNREVESVSERSGKQGARGVGTMERKQWGRSQGVQPWGGAREKELWARERNQGNNELIDSK